MLFIGSSDERLDEDGEQMSEAAFLTFVLISIVLVITAGLMSGLTIGLMALDPIELEVLKRGGTPQEKKHAAAIAPLMKNHHYLLCTLVLWNAASMEALPLFLDRLADPVTAVVLSVTVVLIFGEIVPQSVCTRHGLAVGYYASWLVRALMLVATPVAWPLGKLLDYVLGHGDAALPRGQLRHYVALHSEDEGYALAGQGLTKNELRVINSALELTSKTTRAAMTPLDKVFMLCQDDLMDEKLVCKVMGTGHSRVPVHAAGDRTDIVGLILVKELLLKVSETREIRVRDLPIRSLPSLSATMPMYDALQLFKVGRAHMAILREASPEQLEQGRKSLASRNSSPTAASMLDPGAGSSSREPLLPDPSAPSRGREGECASIALEPMTDSVINITEGVPIGIITIEDVIEELIGDEIIDETDCFTDNAQTARVNTASLAEKLPRNLRAMLALGMFTPRVNPGRARPLVVPAELVETEATSGNTSPTRAAASSSVVQVDAAAAAAAVLASPAALQRSNSSSYAVSKISRAKPVHAKERAAQVVRDAAENGTTDSLL